ncbi:MAG: adenosylcobalamin-dependent ribonucleoside-diphosphate reductase [Ectothiorhodospiraceae bacterium]|nr:adenosylcobalamin-dependent ribonucleoside-diphosphate reductase [Ectothiorhodospiraceae bacterium]
MPPQPVSLDTWDRKYRLRARIRIVDGGPADGTPIDRDVDDTLARVARTLADLEAPRLREHWYERFLWALHRGAIPGGRILANAGAGEHKPATSTINCTVSGSIGDSMDDILRRLHEAGLTLKSGAGIGYEFSTLRPRGAWVAGAGAHTSGPLSFMDVYDAMCRTISSAGDRRGAQMATFDVGHPDVVDFIDAKRESGRLRQFNLSLLVTSDFLRAVEAGADWPLAFPLTHEERKRGGFDLDDPAQVIWRRWPLTDDYILNAKGEVACRVYTRLPARELWQRVMRATYERAEPGFILVDRINEENNNWFCETIRATNPCGEEPLPPYGACLLGSIDLTRFVERPFQKTARFDWQGFREVVAVFTRMLDDVVEISGLPLPEQRAALERTRRHGMGFLGLGSALAMLNLVYGEPRSLRFAARVARELALTGWRTGVELAQEKGPAPLFDEDFVVDDAMLALRPEMVRDGLRPRLYKGRRIKGRVLHARYSRYMQRLAQSDPELVRAIERHGARFTHHTAIAPTGTIALALANNASNGIEPSFAQVYMRNLLREGRRTREAVEVTSFELLAYRALIDPEAAPEHTDPGHRLPPAFVSAADVSPRAHLDMQAAVQPWIDAAISKTVNVPADMPFETFQDVYLDAWKRGLKGCTTFRYNPEAFQGVLLRPQDLKRTRYRFELEDGRVLELAGDETVEYQGETHTAANLYEALKEGRFGQA